MEQPPPLRLLKVLGTNGCKPGQDFLNALHYNKLKICDYEIYFERGEKIYSVNCRFRYRKIRKSPASYAGEG